MIDDDRGPTSDACGPTQARASSDDTILRRL